MTTKKTEVKKEPSHLYKFLSVVFVMVICYYFPDFMIVRSWKMFLGILTIVSSFIGAIGLIIQTANSNTENYY
jgi:hypothetical protein